MDLRAKVKAMETAEEEDFGSTSIAEIRSWLWNTLEYPWTSKLAQFLAFFSLSMVMLSTVTFIISTQLIDPDGNVDYVEYPMAGYLIDLLDNFVTIFFSGEFLTRLVVCPRKVKFLKKSMNIVDLLAIAPFYVSLLLGKGASQRKETTKIRTYIRCFSRNLASEEGLLFGDFWRTKGVLCNTNPGHKLLLGRITISECN